MSEQDTHLLFCGVHVSSRLARMIAELNQSNRRYVEGEPYLSQREAGGKVALGRVLEAGGPVVELEDFARNVRSILRKVFPEERIAERDVRLFVVSRTAEAVKPQDLSKVAGDEVAAEDDAVTDDGDDEFS